jgi:hypothetical protein
MSKLKLKSRNKSIAKRKITKLILNVLKTHRRGTPTKKEGKWTITKRTGELFKNIKPEFKLESNDLTIEVNMMEYYEWLDGGTSKMDGWFFSEEIMDSNEIIKIGEDLIGDTLESSILDMVSNINKK